MTRDEIIRMAREAGFVDKSFCRWGAYTDDLERFVDLIEKHLIERLIASGYRKCAAGQRTTQFCGQLESAVAGAYAAGAAAERDALRAIVQSVSTRVPHILAGGQQCTCSWCDDIRAARAAPKEAK